MDKQKQLQKSTQKKKKRRKIFQSRYFGLIIGLVIVLLLFLISQNTNILDNAEMSMSDVHFQYRERQLGRKTQEGVMETKPNLRLSPDIAIVAVDSNSLERFGKWPFPRWLHGNLLKFFSRITDQNNRENAILLDFFFVEPDKAAHDLNLIEAIRENGRVFLETALDELPPVLNRDEHFKRQEVLYELTGDIKNIKGNLNNLPIFYGLQPPLQPYGRAAHSYGHANYIEDPDQVYRRQPLIVRSTRQLEKIPLDDLTVNTPVDTANLERLEWRDDRDRPVAVELPLTEAGLIQLRQDMEKNAVKYIEEHATEDGLDEISYFMVYKYKDNLVPAITLTLALNYFNKTVDDMEIVLGEYIRIPEPQMFNSLTGEWEPYYILEKEAVYEQVGEVVHEKAPAVIRQVPEVKIPIDGSGRMLINFMGPASFSGSGVPQTFPVRSFSGFASSPPESDPSTWIYDNRAHENKIILVGAFERGIADDQKTTPYGLMYGIEIHANALNTILMGNFLTPIPAWANWLIVLALVMLVAFLSSRMPALGSFLITAVLMVVLFFVTTISFDNQNLMINFTTPAIGMLVAFLSVVAYRAMTEERDKRIIKNMFSTYLSPKVVEQIIQQPPELGGLDKNLTVFFSDIRGFTTLSESMTPQELVGLLNQYLSAMTDIILESEGTLDKYEGDAIMAFWGAPMAQEDHAFRACKASVKQLEVLKELNKTFPPDRQINIGIGLNTGIMTVGNMGSAQRMDYTLIGDNVNLGARLEGTNKAYGTEIIISEYTYEMVKDKVIARELDNIRVKGKNKPVLIYELLDIKEGY